MCYVCVHFQLLELEALPLGPKEAKRRKKIQGWCDGIKLIALLIPYEKKTKRGSNLSIISEVL